MCDVTRDVSIDCQRFAAQKQFTFYKNHLRQIYRIYIPIFELLQNEGNETVCRESMTTRHDFVRDDGELDK